MEEERRRYRADRRIKISRRGVSSALEITRSRRCSSNKVTKPVIPLIPHSASPVVISSTDKTTTNFRLMSWSKVVCRLSRCAHWIAVKFVSRLIIKCKCDVLINSGAVVILGRILQVSSAPVGIYEFAARAMATVTQRAMNNLWERLRRIMCQKFSIEKTAVWRKNIAVRSIFIGATNVLTSYFCDTPVLFFSSVFRNIYPRSPKNEYNFQCIAQWF